MDERIWQKLNLSWDIVPALTKNNTSFDVTFWKDVKIARNLFFLNKRDNMVLPERQINEKPGNYNSIKVGMIRQEEDAGCWTVLWLHSTLWRHS